MPDLFDQRRGADRVQQTVGILCGDRVFVLQTGHAGSGPGSFEGQVRLIVDQAHPHRGVGIVLHISLPDPGRHGDKLAPVAILQQEFALDLNTHYAPLILLKSMPLTLSFGL